MKGYIPVEIPTKSYIKAYIISQLGEKPIMSRNHEIGSKIIDLLQHSLNDQRNRFSNQRYNERLRIYISQYHFNHRGFNLNETNLKNFNSYVENKIKEKFYFLMDFFIELLPSFMQNLAEVRKIMGIDEEAWSTDSMKQDYFRYRKKMGKPLLYEKSFAATVKDGRKLRPAI